MTGSTGEDELPHFVYRFYSAEGVALYIGVTSQVAARLSAHLAKPWWPAVHRIEVDRYDDGLSGRAAEAAAIADEQPVHNITHTGRRRPRGPFGEPRRTTPVLDAREERSRQMHAAGTPCGDWMCSNCRLEAHEAGRRCGKPRCMDCTRIARDQATA